MPSEPARLRPLIDLAGGGTGPTTLPDLDCVGLAPPSASRGPSYQSRGLVVFLRATGDPPVRVPGLFGLPAVHAPWTRLVPPVPLVPSGFSSVPHAVKRVRRKSTPPVSGPHAPEPTG